MTSTIMLKGVVGSTAHGLATESSDIDRAGVFLADTTEVAGLNWGPQRETISKTNPDITYHELGKFLRLILKGNPSVVEWLFLEKYEYITGQMQLMINNRKKFLNPSRIHTAYLGYASSQSSRYRHTPDPKTARHTLRLVEQGTELINTGTMSIAVSDPQFYHDLTRMDRDKVDALLSERVMKFSKLDVDPEMFDFDMKFVRTYLSTIRSVNILQKGRHDERDFS